MNYAFGVFISKAKVIIRLECSEVENYLRTTEQNGTVLNMKH